MKDSTHSTDHPLPECRYGSGFDMTDVAPGTPEQIKLLRMNGALMRGWKQATPAQVEQGERNLQEYLRRHPADLDNGPNMEALIQKRVDADVDQFENAVGLQQLQQKRLKVERLLARINAAIETL